jgi:parallel beta-helix repeat protein
MLSMLILVIGNDQGSVEAAGAGGVGIGNEKYKDAEDKSNIRINHDGQFTAGNGVTGGTGTKSNPYTIEGWNINGIKHGYCIYVGNTTKYFDIFDCFIQNASGDGDSLYWDSGIVIYNATNGKIYNNNISRCGKGVTIHSSNNIQLNNTEFYSCRDRGVWIKDSTLCQVNATVVENVYESDIGNPSFENGLVIFPWKNFAGTTFADNKPHSRRTGSWFLNTSFNPNFYQQKIPVFPKTKYRLTYYTKIAGSGLQVIPNDIITWRTYVNGVQVYNSKHGIGAGWWVQDKCQFTTGVGVTEINLSVTFTTLGGTKVAYEDFSLYPISNTDHYGIYLDNSDYMTVYNNTFLHWDDGLGIEDFDGVDLTNSDHCIIDSNTFHNRTRGVYLSSSDNNDIVWNTLNDGGWSLVSSTSHYNLWDNNTGTLGKFRGMQMSSSNYNEMISNKFTDYGFSGIMISVSFNNSLAFNDIYDNLNHGIYISNSDNLRLHLNDILRNTNHGVYTTSSDLLSLKDNYIYRNTQDGIHLVTTSHTEIIKNNFSDSNNDGIYIDRGDHLTIEDNTMIINGGDGVHLIDCDFVKFSSNKLMTNDGDGLLCDGGSEVNITKNDFYDNNNGATLSSVEVGLFKNNVVTHNDVKGLVIFSTGDVDILLNFFGNNRFEGIEVDGMTLTDSYNIFVHHNNFHKNNGNGIQARDSCLNNRYNTTIQGNWWSDWTSPDYDQNGIVDYSYNLTGSTGAKDWFPLTKPWGSLVIVNPDLTTATEDLFYRNDYDILVDPIGTGHIDPVTSTWTVKSNSDFLSINKFGNLTGTPDNDDVGVFWVNVTVTASSLMDFRNFTLTVINTNDPPVIETANVEDAWEDIPYSVDYNASDVDSKNGDVAQQWSLETNASFLGISSSAGVLGGLPLNEDVGTYWVNVSVSDMSGGSDWTNFTLTVHNINDPPIIITTPKISAVEDTLYYCDFDAVDDDVGDVLTWSVDKSLGFLTMDENTGELSGTPANEHVGEHELSVKVKDLAGEVGYKNFTLVVSNVNDPPVITTNNTKTCHEDLRYSVDYAAHDIDPTLDVMEWKVKTSARFLSMESSTGILSGTPGNRHVGSYWVNVSVSDGKGGRDWTNFTLTVLNTNDIPVFTTVPGDTTIEDTETFTFTVNATDEDVGAILEFGISSDPVTTISIGATTGVINWKPDSEGFYVVNLTVTDQIVTVHHLFNITVLHLNTPPSVTLEKPADGAELNVVNPTFRWVATDPDSKDVTFDFYISEEKGNVDGLNSEFRVGSTLKDEHFSPPASLEQGKTYHWTVIPDDGIIQGTCTSGVWSFTIAQEARINSPPEFLSSPPTLALTGREWFYEPVATDDDPDDIVTISMLHGPNGMVLGEGVLTWTPTINQLGENIVRLEATDGQSSDFQEFVVEVEQTGGGTNTPPTVEPVGDRTVNEGDAILIAVTASDPEGDPLTYRVVDGPEGSWITSTGEFKWQTNKGDAGSHNIVIGVSDGALETTVAFDLDVEGEEEDASFVQTYWWLLVLLLLLVVIIIIVAVVYRRRKQAEEEKYQDEEEEEVEEAPPEEEEVIEAEVASADIFQEKRDASTEHQVYEQMGMPSDMAPEMDIVPDMAAPDEVAVVEGPKGKIALKSWDIGDDLPDEAPTPGMLLLPPAQVFEMDSESQLNIDEVFIMTNDGILLNHYINTQATRIDEDILTGMLTAVQSFIKDSMKKKSDLKQLKMGDFNIIIEKGKLVSAVVFTNAEETETISKQLKPMIKELEIIEKKILEDWDGNVDSLGSLHEYAQKFINGEYA